MKTYHSTLAVGYPKGTKFDYEIWHRYILEICLTVEVFYFNKIKDHALPHPYIVDIPPEYAHLYNPLIAIGQVSMDPYFIPKNGKNSLLKQYKYNKTINKSKRMLKLMETRLGVDSGICDFFITKEEYKGMPLLTFFRLREKKYTRYLFTNIDKFIHKFIDTRFSWRGSILDVPEYNQLLLFESLVEDVSNKGIPMEDYIKTFIDKKKFNPLSHEGVREALFIRGLD